MAWYFYIICFFAGALLGNSIPHFINGISGKRFPTPFTRPSGKKLSSPTVNILWGFVNFIVGYILIITVGSFTLGFNWYSLALMLGVLFIGLFNSKTFGNLRKKLEF
jgi:hypothetical protein